ncbi:Hypothetical predicted protein [Mytilus galloprovincialis]|uniref:Reverse transcriptase domain-containing protein n=1 Tax=Mytilus galloprovincialis TaxID=29158 RepID=A0A8B6BQZ2_MYTGA|nr:Hypothetical predicted protein [Mytilus galloprovincialis]
MPTRETDSQYEYGVCLDIIHSIIEKYQSTHQVVVCGDLNGTLATSRNNKHDQLLKQFVLEMNLSTVGNYEKLSDIREDKTTSENIKTLTSILLKASHLAVPSKITKLKGPKWKASPKVRKHLKTCKQLYSKWKALGKPENHQSKQDLKSEKKKLRSQQRQEQATDRRKLYEQIMDNPSSELFFKLINRNKSKSKTETSGLEIDGKFDFSSQNQSRAFANYYEDLSLPKENEYDNAYLELCQIRQKIVEETFSQNLPSMDPYTEKEVKQAIEFLNTGKSADEHGICAEHLKYAQHTVVPVITKIFNKILQERKVPVDFKSGILTPVLKKEKNPSLVNSYRGITVTPVLSKLHEFCILGKLFINSGTDLQFGFTAGLWPLFASLIISECKCEISSALSLYLATVDVQSAFDVVQHTILLDKLLDRGTHPDIWLLIKDFYSGLTSKVKWQGEFSDSFNIQQGVRQGGILSTHLYKIFVEDLLKELEENSLGFILGTIYCGAPTCADDVALLSSNPEELQVMLNILQRYANQHQYTIHPTKSKIIHYKSSKNPEPYSWNMSGKEISASEETVYGKKILRSTINKYWTYELQEKAKSKSSLSSLNTTILEIGTVHPVWESASQSLLDVRKSMIKARMLTGTYLVQADKYKFSQYKINATCLLCQREDEDLTHVLTFCPALRETRMKYFLPLKILVTNIIGCKGWEQLFNINQNIVALLLDFSVFHSMQNLSKTQKMNVESLTRDFCYKIHIAAYSFLRT